MNLRLRRADVQSLIYEAPVDPRSHGGAHIHFSSLATELARRDDMDVTVVYPGYPGAPPIDVESARRCRIRTLRKSTVALLIYEIQKIAYLAMRRVRSGRQAPVYLTRLGIMSLTTPMARLVGCRVVVEVNGWPASELRQRGFRWPVRKLVDWSVRAQVRSAHVLVCVTEGVADKAREMSTRARVLTLANGCDLGRIPVVAPAETKRRILFIGTLSPWYDLDLVFDALAELNRDATPDETWVLNIVGDGELAADLRDLAEVKNLGDSVEFGGWKDRDGVLDALEGASVCIAPGRPKDGAGTWGSPLKLFEYLAAGRPAVVSDIDGVLELDLPRNAFRYRPGDKDGLVTALRAAEQAPPPNPDELDAIRHSVSWQQRADDLVQFIYESASDR